MAELPEPILEFDDGCPDCGERRAVLPIPLPGVTDDFDWRARDYDSFRLFMMQELAHRHPQRQRWTAADMEVVVVELLAAALDRASHALDAVQAERYLDSARRPQSVRRLLKLIGFDAAQRTDPALLEALPPAPLPDGYTPGDSLPQETPEQKLERFWRSDPQAMDTARALGPRLIAEQRRMVTLEDHAVALARHPLVAAARARLVAMNGWTTLMVAVIPQRGTSGELDLDEPLTVGPPGPNGISTEHYAQVQRFHREVGLPAAPAADTKLTIRRILRVQVESWRMVGSELFLEAATPAPITFTLSVRAMAGYFRSELRQALEQTFSADVGGFFEPGRLGFGEDLFASDLIEKAMSVEGVEVACLNAFRRVGAGYRDRTAAGSIPIAPQEYAQCLHRRGHPETGTFRILVNGGARA